MPEVSEDIIRLQSVPLTREKQFGLEAEFQNYHTAVNYVIRIILKKHITSKTQTIEAVQDEFKEKFDSRPQYIEDVVKTARVEIGRHRKLAKTIRSLRDKDPYFKPDRVIFSDPIVKISEKALLLYTKDGTEIPIPYDKHSRNQVLVELNALATGKKKYGRVRLTRRKEGYIEIDIRVESKM